MLREGDFYRKWLPMCSDSRMLHTSKCEVGRAAHQHQPRTHPRVEPPHSAPLASLLLLLLHLAGWLTCPCCPCCLLLVCGQALVYLLLSSPVVTRDALLCVYAVDMADQVLLLPPATLMDGGDLLAALTVCQLAIAPLSNRLSAVVVWLGGWVSWYDRGIIRALCCSWVTRTACQTCPAQTRPGATRQAAWTSETSGSSKAAGRQAVVNWY